MPIPSAPLPQSAALVAPDVRLCVLPSAPPASFPAFQAPDRKRRFVGRLLEPSARVLAIAAWEVRSFFHRPSAYVALLSAALTAAWSFSWLITLLARGGGPSLRQADDPISQFLGPNVFLIALCTVFVPLLTMNLVAEERRRGTWELLRTAPVPMGHVLLGKFLAGWFLLMAVLAPWAYYLIVLRYWNGKLRMLWEVVPWLDHAGVPFDPGPACGGLLGMTVFGGTFVALGLFASSVCRRPVSAAVLSFLAMAAILFIGVLPRVLGHWGYAPEQLAWLDTVSGWKQWESFSRGLIQPRIIVGHVSLCAVLLWLGAQVAPRVDEA